MDRMRELIEDLVEEHKKILKDLEVIEENLDSNIHELIHLMDKEVEEHALREETELKEIVPESFDFYILEFAHEQVREALEELKDSPSVERARRAIAVLKSHFMEEENIYFPELLGQEPSLGGEG